MLLADDVPVQERRRPLRVAGAQAGGTVLATVEIYTGAIKDLGVPNISLADYRAPENYKASECPLCAQNVPITRF